MARETDKEDRRSILVTLTAEGRKIIDEAISHRLDAARISLGNLKASERRELADLLRRVVLSSERDG